MKSLLIKKFLIKKYGLEHPAFVIFLLTILSSLLIGQSFIFIGITSPFYRNLLVFPLVYLTFTLMVRYWTYNVVPAWEPSEIPLNEKILKYELREDPARLVDLFDFGYGISMLGTFFLLVTVIGFIVFLFYWGPYFLAEVAFEFVLAAKLSKALRKVNKEDFTNSFFHKTLPSFLLIWGICMIFIKMVEIRCPERVSLIEIYRKGCEVKILE